MIRSSNDLYLFYKNGKCNQWLCHWLTDKSTYEHLGKLATPVSPLMNKVGKSPLTFAKSFSVTGCLLLVFWRHIARIQRYLTENRCTSNNITQVIISLFIFSYPPSSSIYCSFISPATWTHGTGCRPVPRLASGQSTEQGKQRTYIFHWQKSWWQLKKRGIKSDSLLTLVLAATCNLDAMCRYRQIHQLPGMLQTAGWWTHQVYINTFVLFLCFNENDILCS